VIGQKKLTATCSIILETISIFFGSSESAARTMGTDTTRNSIGMRLPEPRKIMAIFLFRASLILESR